MSPLPEERDLTLNAQTPWPSATGNRVQDQIVELSALTRGSGFSIHDDFTGDTLDGSVWVSGSGVTGASVRALVNDHVAGGFGALSLKTGAGDSCAAGTRLLPIGAADMRFGARVRRVQHTAGYFQVGLESGVAAEKCNFRSTAGGNWFWYLGAANGDTGVACTTAYQWLEFRRIAGVVTFYIAGLPVYSAAMATAITAATLLMAEQACGLNDEHRVDLISLWSPR